MGKKKKGRVTPILECRTDEQTVLTLVDFVSDQHNTLRQRNAAISLLAEMYDQLAFEPLMSIASNKKYGKLINLLAVDGMVKIVRKYRVFSKKRVRDLKNQKIVDSIQHVLAKHPEWKEKLQETEVIV